MKMRDELKAELTEIEQMVEEAKQHDDYTEKYFVLREGMIKLAGGFVQAALLSSLLGWTRHWLKTDNEVYKQIQVAAQNKDLKKVRHFKKQIRQGWFWKSYREMAKELLDQVSAKTCERYVNSFEKMGLIESREPEEKAIYRAKWYKADVVKIKEELNNLGFDLDHYKDHKNSIGQNVRSQNTSVSSPKIEQIPMLPIGQNDECAVVGLEGEKQPKSVPLRTRQNDEPYRQNDEPYRQNDEHLLNTSFISPSFKSTDDDDANELPNYGTMIFNTKHYGICSPQ
jgi:hypothetical protein